MDCTFAMRRTRILENDTNLNDLFKDFPFLHELEQVKLSYPYLVCSMLKLFTECLLIVAHETIGANHWKGGTHPGCLSQLEGESPSNFGTGRN